MDYSLSSKKDLREINEMWSGVYFTFLYSNSTTSSLFMGYVAQVRTMLCKGLCREKCLLDTRAMSREANRCQQLGEGER